ncbi:substrate-binding domain-containing protein [Kitasatospora herbaricolor]|uniref:substrate-binding domain-containing protein n=1 Tax=Kitasatospora herbaricolor TaxID=68217 RepID=UPI0036DC2EF1
MRTTAGRLLGAVALATAFVPGTAVDAVADPPVLPPAVLALHNTTSAAVDFTRAEVLPADIPTYVAASDTFVRFAKDAVSWSATSGGHAPAMLTLTDLRNIYSGVTTNWAQITDVPGCTGPNATIKPYLPPANSGLRAVFLTAIGSPPVSSNVVTAATENEGTAPQFNGAALRGIFGPTGWICANGAADIQSYGFLVLPPTVCGTVSPH